MKNIEEVINQDKYLIHNIKGISMLPLLVDKEDLVLIEKQKQALEKLDMVLFKRDEQNKYVLHRILDIKDKYYLICGDNQNTLEKVYPKQIIGKVTGYYKNGRFVSIKDKEYLDYLNELELDLSKRRHLLPINKDQYDFIKLIKQCIFNVQIDQSSFNFEAIYKLSKKHCLTAFIFKTISKDKCPDNIYQDFKRDYDSCVKKTVSYDGDRKKIYQVLDTNKIKYVPLLNTTINNLYPEYGTRYFIDEDILIEENKETINILKDIGYSYIQNNTYEYVFKKENTFRLYTKLLIPNAIEKTKQHKDFLHRFSDELFYVYFLLCFKKLFYENYANIKFFIDLYYLKKNLSFDERELNMLLKEYDLLDFDKKINTLFHNVFISDESSIQDLNLLFFGLNFNQRKYIIENSIKKQGKYKYFINRVFPSYKVISKSYPILKKYPFLLPGVWMYRILAPSKRKNIKLEKDILFKSIDK